MPDINDTFKLPCNASCTAYAIILYLLLAAAPVCSLRLIDSGPAPALPFTEQDEFDDLVDKLDEEELISAIDSFEPSEELISAWSKAWAGEWANNTKSKQAKEGLEAAVSKCKRSIKSHLSNEKMVEMSHSSAARYCADPWFQTKNCSQPFTIPGYRLGDLLKARRLGAGWEVGNLINYVNNLYPESIGAKFAQANPRYWRLPESQKLARLYKTITGAEYADYERPEASDLVIHVRAFDILKMCGGVDHVWSDAPTCGGWQRNMVKGQKYWESTMKTMDMSNLKRAVLVTGDHMHTNPPPKPSTSKSPSKPKKGSKDSKPKKGPKSSPAIQPPSEDEVRTDQYIELISRLITTQTGLPVTIRKNGNADCDFIYMSSASPGNWIRTGGQFDMLIDNMISLGSASTPPPSPAAELVNLMSKMSSSAPSTPSSVSRLARTSPTWRSERQVQFFHDH